MTWVYFDLTLEGKIQHAAVEAGMETQAFCDMNCKTFEVGDVWSYYSYRL